MPQPWQASVLARPSSRYFAVRSDPSRRDSDGDLRDDPTEYAQGTDPLEVDYYTRPRTPSSPGTGQRPAAAIYTAVNPSATEPIAADGTASWPSDAQMKWRKDPYPSWEVYRDSPAGVPVQTLYRWEQTDAGPWALNEFNWWDRGLCLRYNEDRSIPDAYNWIARGGGFWSFIGLSDLRCPSGLWTGW